MKVIRPGDAGVRQTFVVQAFVYGRIDRGVIVLKIRSSISDSWGAISGNYDGNLKERSRSAMLSGTPEIFRSEDSGDARRG